MNHVFRGTWLRCMTVPALTEVSLPQAAHSQLARRRFSSQPLSWPQAGQTKPSGQRLAARWRAQAASSGKRASKAARDIGRSCFQRLGMSEQQENIKRRSTPNTTSRKDGFRGISLSPQCAFAAVQATSRVPWKTGIRTSTSLRWVTPPACGSLVMKMSPGRMSHGANFRSTAFTAASSVPMKTGTPAPWEASSPRALVMPTPSSRTS